MSAPDLSASKGATEAYRRRLFVGVGKSFEEAMANGRKLAHDAGFASADVMNHRVAPQDAKWDDADWRDTDWRDTDWRDTDWRDTDWRDTHVVIVHGSPSQGN
jgi:hypothetical protein